MYVDGDCAKGKGNWKGKRKGKCHECGEYGHWRCECPKQGTKKAQGSRSSSQGSSGSANVAEKDWDKSLAVETEEVLDVDEPDQGIVDDNANWVSATVSMEVDELEGEWWADNFANETEDMVDVCDMSDKETMARQVQGPLTST